MSTLGDLREGLLMALATVQAEKYVYVPERISPPALIVLPGSPYVEPGDVFGSFLVRHSISVVMATGSNEKTSEDIDALIESVLLALADARVSIEAVSTFYVYESNGGQHLAADITITDNVFL